jgi:branched-chain amino acid transport system substrate-binding protein
MKINVGKVVVAALGLSMLFSTAHAQEFLVGSEYPLTGAFARAGIAMHSGLMVAAELFNRHNPKHKVKIISLDNESSPAKAVAAVEKLAAQNVVAVTGGYGTNLIGPASTAAEKAGLVYATSGGVATQLVKMGHKRFFRINNTPGYSKAIIGFLADQKIKSVSVIVSTKEATAGLADTVKDGLTARGIKVFMHPFDPAMTDFKPIVNKIKVQDRPDAIVMVAYENDYVAILRALKVIKPPTVKAVIGPWALATPKMATEFADLVPNVYGNVMLPYPAEFRSAEGKEFFATYKKLFNKVPGEEEQWGFVISQLLFESIVKSYEKGTLAKGGLADEMRKTNRNTLIGHVQFDAEGDYPNFLEMMGQHQNGKIVVVWPKE